MRFRETEWIFSTSKGRIMLRKQCGKHRLAVVRLFREQKYDSLQVIQIELNSIVLRFKPKGVSGKVRGGSAPLLGSIKLAEVSAAEKLPNDSRIGFLIPSVSDRVLLAWRSGRHGDHR